MRTSEETGDTVTLPAVVDLAAAEALLTTLRQRLAAGQACHLDASTVERLLLPGIQVILAAIRSSEKVQVINPSAALRGAFDEAAISWTREDEAQGTPAQARAKVGAQATDQANGAESQPALAAAAARASATPQDEARADRRRIAKRILTIDDSRTMRDMLRFTLVDAGYDVLQAVDGQDGLDVLSRERVDVVITDINMPKLDGYGVIRYLRADAGYDDTPILVLSTESDQKTKDIGRDAGATGWLVKPFDPEQLVEIVRQVSP